MEVVKTVESVREIISEAKSRGLKIGFVPTMGYLHKGHLSLVEKAFKESDFVVVSIFVNPTQFAPHEDLDCYPRDLERDIKLLGKSCNLIFNPDVSEMYRGDQQIGFKISSMTACMCGVSRPDHFSGVMQIVAKLLNIIRPDSIYFGQKDYQQSVLISRLISDLFFPVKMVVCPIVREADGLAMSSRNVYLNEEERKQSTVLRKSLLKAKDKMDGGERKVEIIRKMITEIVESMSLARIDYVEIRDADSLGYVDIVSRNAVVVALAVFFGKTRLIDNLIYYPLQNEVKR